MGVLAAVPWVLPHIDLLPRDVLHISHMQVGSELVEHEAARRYGNPLDALLEEGIRGMAFQVEDFGIVPASWVQGQVPIGRYRKALPVIGATPL